MPRCCARRGIEEVEPGQRLLVTIETGSKGAHISMVQLTDRED